jgi:hypothetical protein
MAAAFDQGTENFKQEIRKAVAEQASEPPAAPAAEQ